MYDLAIIGGGPGGYAAALYAHNFGLSVVLVESDRVGGTCLHRGCVPAKAWLESAEVYSTVAGAGGFGVIVGQPHVDWGQVRARKDRVVGQLHKGLVGLLKQRGVDVRQGKGRLDLPGAITITGSDGRSERIEAAKIILATGSIPGSIPGYPIDGQRIVTSDQALDWESRPARVAVIGAGPIGCEFASFLTDLGARVSLFEIMEQILPGMEPEAARIVHRDLASRGVEIRTGTAVEPAVRGPGEVVVPFPGGSEEVDVVLVAAGRVPVTAGIGLEQSRAEIDRGFVKVDPATMETAEPGVYAVGDIVSGSPQLAHVGFAEGISAVTHIATGVAQPVNYRAVPQIVYTSPQAASVGLTEARARAEGREVQVTSHGFGGVARALIRGQNRGVVKIIAEVDGPILGATVVGPEAGELIHELVLAVGWEALPAEAAFLVHGHPTLAEAVGEALLSAAGRSLH
jgi:dihydrolipoamide dehydrogenase